MIIGLSHQIPEFNNIDPYSGNIFFPTLKYIKINGIQTQTSMTAIQGTERKLIFSQHC